MSISILLTAYNATKFLGETLASISAQVRKPDEVIVVDDHSDDNTVAIAETWAKEQPYGVRILQNRIPHHSFAGPGPAAGRMTGLQEVKSDMVALLEKAGAKPYEDFKIDPAMLAKFAGTYKGTAGNELTIIAAGARVTLGPAAAPPAQRVTLVATGAKAFKAIGAPLSVTFQVDGDKVASFTLTQGANPGQVYTRVEGK